MDHPWLGDEAIGWAEREGFSGADCLIRHDGMCHVNQTPITIAAILLVNFAVLLYTLD